MTVPRATSQTTALARTVTRSAEAVASDVELLKREQNLLALIQAGRDAIQKATTIEEAQSVLARTKVLEAATRAVDLAVEQIAEAAALRVRAERRIGELLRETRARGERDAGGRGPIVESQRATQLKDLGVTKSDSSRFQRLAALPEKRFEKSLAKVKDAAAKRHGGVTTTSVLREAMPEQERRPDEQWLMADRFVDRCQALLKEAPEVLTLVRFGRYPADEDALVYRSALSTLKDLAAILRQIQSEISRRQP